ncbi:MAG: DUF2603 domain-containing protein [Campylobacter sp.]|nr:DUF2603 domain-containing protein [Campylobacter sp.]
MKEKSSEKFEEIDELSRSLDIQDEERTIFEISPINEQGQRTLKLKSGSWEGAQPWFGVDEKYNLYSMVSLNSLSTLLSAYRSIQRENFDLRLEKTIWQNFPADFGDVWMVAMDEIKKIADENNRIGIDIDLEHLLKKIKNDYPNLFVDIKSIINIQGRDDD